MPRELKADRRSVQGREAQQRARARKKLIAQGLPIPPELAVRPTGFSGRYTEEEKKQLGRDAAARYKANHPTEVNDAHKARQDRNRVIVNEVKANPCEDCGRTFLPVCMDFDHREGEVKRYGRTGGVAGLIGKGSSVEALLAEIAKCDLVCACCHRIRTAKKNGWDESLTTTPEQETQS